MVGKSGGIAADQSDAARAFLQSDREGADEVPGEEEKSTPAAQVKVGERTDAAEESAAGRRKQEQASPITDIRIPVHVPAEKRLGVVFDIDGTLVAEQSRDLYCGMKLRPGALEFMQWLTSRGHRLGLWTKASKFWSHRVVKKACPLVSGPHDCSGTDCRRTFDFVWSADKLKRQNEPSRRWQHRGSASSTGDDECKWCEAYSSACHQCECMWNYECPCRYIKDLRKIWYSSDEETKDFVRERTLIVEDTPQNCRYNYGNAIYVPTYKGYLEEDGTGDLFTRIRAFFERELETCDDVRYVRKCDHGKHYHACYRQSWMTSKQSMEVDLSTGVGIFLTQTL